MSSVVEQDLLRHWGSRAVALGPNQIRFENRGTGGTVLLALGGAFFALGTIANLVLALANSGETRGPLLAGTVVCAVGLGVGVLFLRRRLRSGGVFVLDGAARTLSREGGPTWPLTDISFETKRDLFERNPMALVKGQSRWLIAHVDGGSGLRLCKGHPGELERVLEVLRQVGLHVS